MSVSNRGKLPKIGGLILATLAIVAAWFIISDFSATDRAYIKNAAHESQNYADQTQYRIRDACGPVASVGHQDCVAKEDATAREYERNEYDLAAQMTMAWWTKIMGAAAVLGVLLSAVGVYLIWETFRETKAVAATGQAANKIAREAVDNAAKEAGAAKKALILAERAVMELRHVAVGLPPLDAPGGIMLHFKMFNIGRGNARNFRIFYRVAEKPVFSTKFDHSHIYDRLCLSGKEINLPPFKVKEPKVYPTYYIGYVSYTTLHDAEFSVYFCLRMNGKTEQDAMGQWLHAYLEECACQKLPTST